MQISLAVDKPAAPVRVLDGIPVYAMGHDLAMTANFKNVGPGKISIDDPQTSQAVTLRLRQKGPEDAAYMIHPSRIDATGEITAPPTSALDLVPGQSTSVTVNLHGVIVDKCFLPGIYEIYVEFNGIRSAPLVFAVEYRPESVPPLVTIAVDEAADPWVREEAVAWLNKLPRSPKMELPIADEPEEARNRRINKNQSSAGEFLDYWRYGRNPQETETFFEQFRLRPEVPGEVEDNE